ncbi:MAG: Ribosome-binding factor A [Ktedonobacterales bacterium]|jgi:ribosome-binding factor A|nr:MAG: Ribosome-binding factor A [Ktedonobacterales bacterium]
MSKRWRQDQLGEVIAHELSDLIRTRLKDPRVGFASITDVEVTQDIRHAKVFVSVMGSEEEQRETLATLEHASGFLRHELAQRLTVRHTPDLLFRLDTSIERGTHVLGLINQVSAAGASTPAAAEEAQSATAEKAK